MTVPVPSGRAVSGSPHLLFVGSGSPRSFDTEPTGSPNQFRPKSAFFCLPEGGQITLSYLLEAGTPYAVPVGEVSLLHAAGRIYTERPVDQRSGRCRQPDDDQGRG